MCNQTTAEVTMDSKRDTLSMESAGYLKTIMRCPSLASWTMISATGHKSPMDEVLLLVTRTSKHQ